MVPARDFEVSRRFYIELGFQPRPLADRLVEMQLGSFSFILQDHYVREWADNFVMHVAVSDVGLWWDHIASLDLPSAGVARLGGGRGNDRSLRRALEICSNASMTMVQQTLRDCFGSTAALSQNPTSALPQKTASSRTSLLVVRFV
jgi:hypothetical protein